MTIEPTTILRKQNTVFVLLIIALSGCASTGKVVNNTFIDTRYNIDIQFPASYSVKPISAPNARYRVEAFYRDMSFNRRSMMIVPSYALFIVPKNPSQTDTSMGIDYFKEFVFLESLNYCIRLYMLNAHQYGEQTLILNNGKPVIIRYFNSSALLPSFVTAYGNGVAAFINWDDCLMKLEYIADSKMFNKDEFLGVLQSINHK